MQELWCITSSYTLLDDYHVEEQTNCDAGELILFRNKAYLLVPLLDDHGAKRLILIRKSFKCGLWDHAVAMMQNKLLSSPRWIPCQRTNCDVGVLILRWKAPLSVPLRWWVKELFCSFQVKTVSTLLMRFKQLRTSMCLRWIIEHDWSFTWTNFSPRSSPRWLPCQMDVLFLVWSLKLFNFNEKCEHAGALIYNKLISYPRWLPCRRTNELRCWRITGFWESKLLSFPRWLESWMIVLFLVWRWNLNSRSVDAKQALRFSLRWLQSRKVFILLVTRWNISTPEVWMHNKLLSSFLSSVTRKSNGFSSYSYKMKHFDSRSVDAWKSPLLDDCRVNERTAMLENCHMLIIKSTLLVPLPDDKFFYLEKILTSLMWLCCL
jgi:hypothetical protein